MRWHCGCCRVRHRSLLSPLAKENRMKRSLLKKALASTGVLLVCLGVVGCGGAADEPISCEKGTFRLVGSIDDMSVDVTQSSQGSEFVQIPPADFATVIEPSLQDPSTTDLRETWTGVIRNGGTSPATATLKHPSCPFSDDTFCAGAGTTIHVAPEGNSYNINLTSLTSGPGCATVRRGSLQACSNFN